MCVLFAATYPERTQALVLYGAYGHFPSWVLPAEKLAAFLEMVERDWGTGASLKAFAPGKLSDERFKRWWARFERLGASPSAVTALMRMNSEIDIRHILPAIRVPTLILHRKDDPRVSVEAGRYLGSAIPGAKYVELPGSDHVAWVGDVDRLTDEIEQFLTGARAVLGPDRILATVLFTDIVDSTKRAAEIGDRRWQAVLEQHDQIVRVELARYRGHEIKTLGDGFLATFDGPARAVRCANAIVTSLRELDLQVRCGVHTGEIEMKGDDIGGIAVHIAARIAAIAEGGQVLVSRTVRDLVAGSDLTFEDRGAFVLKGLSERMPLFAIAPDRVA
jgi:class 3 adenylate cyclase